MEVGGIVEPVIEPLKFQIIFLRNFIRVIDFVFITCYNAGRVIGDRLFPVCANRRNRNSRFYFLIEQTYPPAMRKKNLR